MCLQRNACSIKADRPGDVYMLVIDEGSGIPYSVCSNIPECNRGMGYSISCQPSRCYCKIPIHQASFYHGQLKTMSKIGPPISSGHSIIARTPTFCARVFLDPQKTFDSVDHAVLVRQVTLHVAHLDNVFWCDNNLRGGMESHGAVEDLSAEQINPWWLPGPSLGMRWKDFVKWLAGMEIKTTFGEDNSYFGYILCQARWKWIE